MSQESVEPVAVGVDPFTMLVGRQPPPASGIQWLHAGLVEHFDDALDRADGGYFFFTVTADRDWPSLVVTQQFSPAGAGFGPGALLVPRTATVFLGAGTRLLGYQLGADGWRRLWEDEAECGFWSWRQHGDVVLMSAELELAAWHVGGEKLWTRFVEPPWTYRVIDDRVELDVMGTVTTFGLTEGFGCIGPDEIDCAMR
jgi:hypothetical protein